MKFILSAKLWAIMLPLAILAITAGTVFAHERRNLGKYEVVVGWIVEPAFEGQKTGVDLRVTNTETSKPVEGLEKTLQVEITHLSSGTTKTFALRTIFRDPGHYTNDLIITAPGQYRFRFFGDIEGTPVNENFESGPGRFNDMQSAADLQFPEKFPEVREISGVARASQQTALDASDAASAARTVGMVGVVLGAVGITIALGSLMLVARRR